MREVRIRDAFSFTKINVGQREPGRGIENRQDAVCEFNCTVQVEFIVVSQLVSREKTPKDTNGSLCVLLEHDLEVKTLNLLRRY